ncbi:MAG TPA: DUF4442 domain-containing protein [Bdellovibrionota bacterium]|nr:DUF4442 domain-containing protein [Bdellovibrionota bacterium]
MKKTSLLRLLNLWPPYLGAGIRVKRIAPDFRSIDVEMNLRFWNQNYVGVHFGGSLYAMTDPFIMLMLMENLGKDYIVWDKAASIRFRKPGKGRVRVRFELSQERLDEIRRQADELPKVEPVFQVQITGDAGEVIAEVEKTLWVKRKTEA